MLVAVVVQNGLHCFDFLTAQCCWITCDLPWGDAIKAFMCGIEFGNNRTIRPCLHVFLKERRFVPNQRPSLAVVNELLQFHRRQLTLLFQDEAATSTARTGVFWAGTEHPHE